MERNVCRIFFVEKILIEKNTIIQESMEKVLGPNYKILLKKFIVSVPLQWIPDWIKEDTKGIALTNLGPYIRPEYSDMTYFIGVDFHQDLIDLVKKYEHDISLKVEEDLEHDIIKIFGVKITSLARAQNGLNDMTELAYTTAEHHPYWALLYNSSLISKAVLEKWSDDLSEEDLGEIQWMVSELQNSCDKLMNKITEQGTRDK